MTVAECAAAPSLRFGMACAEAGDVVLFNGKCLRKIAMLSRFATLSVSLTLSVSPF